MLSFFRKLSIGGKIKDGLLPEGIMETAQDLSITREQNALMLKTDTELRESVYGKLRTICVLYRPSNSRILFDVRKTVRRCVRQSLYICQNILSLLINKYPNVD